MFLMVLAFGVFKHQQKDKKEHAKSPLAMSFRETIAHAMIYGLMVAAAFAMM